MSTNDIVDAILLMEKNLDYYRNKVILLQKQISDMTDIADTETDLDVELTKSSYTKEEIHIAYNRCLKYEGLVDRKGSLIIDTFLAFLNESHHSLKS